MRAISIKNRIIFTILFAVVVSTSVIAYVAQTKSRSLLISRLEKSELPNLVQRVGQAVDGEISEMMAITKGIANNPFVIKVIDNSNDAETDKLLAEYLSNVANVNGLSNASFIDRRSDKYWNQNGFLRKFIDNDHNSWYFDFKNSGSADSSSTYTEKNGTISIFVN